jgi:hypothetical protein
MKMIRAGGVFNFREMIAHVNSNKKLQDFTIPSSCSNTWPLSGDVFVCDQLACLISPSADKVGCRIIKVARNRRRHLLR